MILRTSSFRLSYWSPRLTRRVVSQSVRVHSGRFSSNAFLALSVVGLSLIFLSLSATKPIQALKASSFEVAHRLVYTCDEVVDRFIYPFQKVGRFFKLNAQLQQEIELLQQQNANLLKWKSLAQDMKTENAQLKQQAKVITEKPWALTVARVLQIQWSEQGGYLLIGGGADLIKDQPVITEAGVVGRVLDSGETVTRVLLITDSKSRIPVMVAGTSHHAILAGTDGELLKVSRVAQQTPLKVGDFLVTSGYGGIFPAGLPVAEVVAIKEEIAYARPLAFSQGQLRASFVQVIKFSK